MMLNLMGEILDQEWHSSSSSSSSYGYLLKHL